MSDTPTTREYRVLCARDDGMEGDFDDLGTYTGGSADAAITKAIEIYPSMPSGSTCIAVPRTNWTERQVVVEQVPKVTLLQPDGQATIAEPGE